MKKFVIMLLVSICSIYASAQIVEGLRYPRAHFGLRLAYTSNSLSGDNVSSTATALPYISAGCALDFRVASIPLYLETGMYYVNKGSKDVEHYYINNRYYSDEDVTYNNHSLVIPLLLSYHLYFTDNMSIQPFAGVFFGYQTEDERLDGIERYEWGFRVGMGWNLGRLYLNTGYDFGAKSENYYNNTLFVTLGINLGGSY